MTARLTLALGATYVQAELQLLPLGVLGFFSHAPSKTAAVKRVSIQPTGLEVALDQTIANLDRESSRQLRGAHLEVQLGFDHSRVSLRNALASGSHDDLHVLAQGIQKSEQAVRSVAIKLASQQCRDLGLINA